MRPGRVAVVCALGLALALGLAVARGARLGRADLAFANGAEPTSLDPATVSGVAEMRLVRFLFEGLVVKHPRTLEPVPGAAESWEVSPDGLRWRFRLREDARWSNGDALTAEDFRWSFARVLDPRTASPWAYQLHAIAGARAWAADAGPDGAPRRPFDEVGVRATSPRELEVELEHPTPYFLELCATTPFAPVHRASLEALRARDPEAFESAWLKPGNLVSNGPWLLAGRRVQDRIRFARNPFYWDRANVALDTVDALAVEHLDTQLNLYLAGEVAWVDGAPPNLVSRLRAREDFRAGPYLATYFYRVNVTRPPFDDPRVRRALALAVPRRAIVESVTKAGEAPSWSAVAPGIPGYEPAALRRPGGPGALPPSEQGERADLDEARALLAAAGYGPGGRPMPRVEIHYNNQAPHADVAEVVADAWRRELGVEARLAPQEWKVFLATQRELDYDVSRSSWIADYRDPRTFLEVFAGSSENNRTGWSDPAYDALLERAARCADGPERARLYREAEERLLEALPILPIYSYASQNLVDPGLGGFEDNVLDEHAPKFWYWRDEAELAERRAALPPGTELVRTRAPREGLYAPADARSRAAREAGPRAAAGPRSP